MRKTVLVGALLLAWLPRLDALPLSQVLASDEDRREALTHYRAGQELLMAEQWEKAAREFQRAIDYDRLFTDAHYGLGQAYMGLERYASAILAFEGCIDAARSLYDLSHRNRVLTDRAIDDEIRELKDSVRRIASRQTRVAQPDLKQTQLQHRIAELERSRSSLGPVFVPPATVLLSLGSAHFRNGDRDAAERFWYEAVTINRELGAAWNNLAVIYLGSGRKKEAEDAVRSAERAGFQVHPQLKADIRAMKK